MRNQPAAAARMTRLSPEIRVAATLLLLFLIALLSDQWTFHHFIFRGINQRAWGRMLRLAGYLPLWGIVALALVLHDWVPRKLSTLPAASGRVPSGAPRSDQWHPCIPVLVRTALLDRSARAAEQ